MEEIVKPIILTHKRAGKIETHLTVPNSAICVPESQVGEYKEHYPDLEMIVHPDTVVGYAAKVKWIYKKIPNVFMLDDDLSYMMRLWDDEDVSKVQPEVVYALIQSLADVAKQMKVKFFGFGKLNQPFMYNGINPFLLNGLVIGGQFGFHEGFQIDQMPDSIVGSTDYFLTGLNAFYNRRTIIDQRFAFCSDTGTFKSEGGMSDIRDINTEKEDLLFLKKKFGDAIQLKGKTGARKVLQHEYERTLIIPY